MRSRFIALVLSLSGILPAAASSRVGNGIVPSIDYVCVEGDPFFEGCQGFESSLKIAPSDFPEGSSFYFADGARYALLVVRSGDRLSYLDTRAFARPESARRHLEARLGSARPLLFDGLLAEALDRTPRTQVVIRRTPGGELWVRREVKLPSQAYYAEKDYFKAGRR